MHYYGIWLKRPGRVWVSWVKQSGCVISWGQNKSVTHNRRCKICKTQQQIVTRCMCHVEPTLVTAGWLEHVSGAELGVRSWVSHLSFAMWFLWVFRFYLFMWAEDSKMTTGESQIVYSCTKYLIFWVSRCAFTLRGTQEMMSTILTLNTFTVLNQKNQSKVKKYKKPPPDWWRSGSVVTVLAC